jgi:hypothetical protein
LHRIQSPIPFLHFLPPFTSSKPLHAGPVLPSCSPIWYKT